MDEVTAVAVLPPGYQALFQRARARLQGDERVRGLWLGGSLARGTADEASDLDLIVAVADGAFDEFAASWRDWLGDITPTVLAETLPFAKGIVYSVTPAFERFDIVVERVSSLPETIAPRRTMVFDKDDLTSTVPTPDAGPPPSRDAVATMITEYFRMSAIETILVRQDWLLAREHLHVVSSLTYRLFVEANAPQPPMGVKQWSTRLTPAQRDALLELPATANDLEELRRAHVAMARLFVPNAEVLAARLDVEWPATLERAAAAHLSRHLGIEDPYPRGGTIVVS